MSSVVIVESPAKAKTINKYLGSDYTVLASYGHVRDLPPKDGSVRPDDDFSMSWQIDDKSQKHVREIAKALKGAKTAKKSSDEDAVKFIKKTIVKTEAPAAPARTGKALEIEKFLRQVAAENGIKINFDKCSGGVCKPAPKNKPAPKKKSDDDLYSDDSDLESCDDEE